MGGTNTVLTPAHGAGRQVPLLREWVWLQERSEEVLSETVVSRPVCIRSAWVRLCEQFSSWPESWLSPVTAPCAAGYSTCA